MVHNTIPTISKIGDKVGDENNFRKGVDTHKWAWYTMGKSKATDTQKWATVATTGNTTLNDY